MVFRLIPNLLDCGERLSDVVRGSVRATAPHVTYFVLGVLPHKWARSVPTACSNKGCTYADHDELNPLLEA